jgi:ElaB/YqjD/DUF883 family membrane-anchored ribosome-binding protein
MIDDDNTEPHVENTADDADVKEALSMGWSPREKWRGDPDSWVDAKEYRRRAKEHLPIVQGLLKREQEARQRERDQAKREIEAIRQDFDRRLKVTGSVAEDAIRKLREQHLTELELERRRIATSPATPEQRAQQFEDVTRAEQQLLERFRREDEDRQEQQRQARVTQPNVPPEVLDWGSRNPWFYALKQSGSPIAQEAEAIHMMLNAQGMPLAENLDEVTRRIGERYPHIVYPADTQRATPAQETDDGDSVPTRREPARRPSSVEGQSNGRATAKNTGAKGWRDIPAAERELMTTSFINNGLYGDPTKDGLAKVQAKAAEAYWSQYPEG